MQNDIPEIPSAPQNLLDSPPEQQIDFFNQGDSAAKPNMAQKASNGNLSDEDFGDFNLENELAQNNVPAQQNNFELGGSVTKEMLHETNKQINEDNLDDQLGDLNNFDNNMNDVLDDLQNVQEIEEQTGVPKGKKNLQIDIDENADYESQNDRANQQLNDKLQ